MARIEYLLVNKFIHYICFFSISLSTSLYGIKYRKYCMNASAFYMGISDVFQVLKIAQATGKCN